MNDAAPAAAPPEPGDPEPGDPEPGDPEFVGPVRLVFWEGDPFSFPYLRVPVPFGLFLRLPRHPSHPGVTWAFVGPWDARGGVGTTL